MPWDAMSAKRNEMKRIEMEWNRTTTGGTAPQHAACSLYNCLHLLHIFAFYFLLHSVHLTHSLSPPFLLSCSFVPLGGNCSNLRARPLSTKKKGKQVTNKKRVKIKKNIVARKLHNRPRPKGRPWRGREAWHVDFVLCAVFSANVRSFFAHRVLAPSSYITIFSPRPLNKLHKHLLPG